MDKNKRVELATPALFIAFSIYILIVAFTLPDVEGIFPAMIGVLMLLSSGGILIKGLRSQKAAIDISKVNIRNLAKISAALVVYILIFNRAGYVISTLLLGIYTLYALGIRDLKKLAIFPAAIVLVLFVGFRVLLNVQLPMIFFDF